VKLGNLQAREAVRDVGPDRVVARPRRRRRMGLRLEGGQQQVELIGGPGAERVALDQFRDRFT
jgi:hypothetical protein